MANDITSAALSDSSLNSYYQSFLKELPMETVEYTPIQMGEQTVESIGNSVSSYLRNYYDKAIKSRRSSTQQNNAAIDVDAASRGMGQSTWLTDAKNRQYQAEAADISAIEGDYASKLAETVYGQYNNYVSNKLGVDSQNVSNKLEVDKWNAQVRATLEELAYSRALDEYSRAQLAARSSGGGGYSRPSGDIEVTEEEPNPDVDHYPYIYATSPTIRDVVAGYKDRVQITPTPAPAHYVYATSPSISESSDAYRYRENIEPTSASAKKSGKR